MPHSAGHQDDSMSQHAGMMQHGTGGPRAEASHIRLLLDRAEICQTSANFMPRGSELHGRTRAVCAEVCDRCAQDRDRFGDDVQMQARAESCRRRAASCRRMAGTMTAYADAKSSPVGPGGGTSHEPCPSGSDDRAPACADTGSRKG